MSEKENSHKTITRGNQEVTCEYCGQQELAAMATLYQGVWVCDACYDDSVEVYE